MSDLVVRSADALSGQIDGEVVALDVGRGACYGLDPVGSRIWALIEGPTAIGDLCVSLMAEYEVDAGTCRRDVIDLLSHLSAEGLIRVERPSTPSVD